MRLVEDPGTDLAVLQGVAEGGSAKLLGSDEDQPQIPETQLLEHRLTLQRGEQAVEKTRAGHAARLQVVHLILHQRLQRRDHHREAAGAVVARQGRQLEAQRFAPAGGQNGQGGATGKAVLHDRPLQRASVGCCGRWPEVGDAREIVREHPLQIVLLAAPGAGRIGTGYVAQRGDGFPGLGKAQLHPGRQHRVTARHPQPSQGIGQRLMPLRIG